MHAERSPAVASVIQLFYWTNVINHHPFTQAFNLFPTLQV